MSILTRYILKQFLRSAAMMVVGLSAIFMVFDVLANAGEITQNSASALQTIWQYMGLRLPGIFVLVMPIGALLATMITMHKMVKSREMIVIGGAGFAIYHIAYILALGACGLGILQFSISELAASQSNVRLRLWAEQEYQGPPPEAPEAHKTLWAQDGPYILHYQRESMDGTALYDLVLIERDDQGSIKQVLRSRRAVYKDDGWVLYGLGGKEKEKKIALSLKPEDFSIPAQHYEEIRFVDLWPLVFRAQVQEAPGPYGLWLQRKVAQPLSVVLMALLAVPIGLFMARSYNSFLLSFAFVMIGFLFFISERLLLSMGESFILPSFLAVWSPHLIFGMMGLWFMIYKQE